MRRTKRPQKPQKQNKDVIEELQNLIAAELANINTAKSFVILPWDSKNFQIKDYIITLEDEKVLVSHNLVPVKEFYTKQCAILYVISLLANDIMGIIKVEKLDRELFFLKNDQAVLESVMKRTVTTDPFKSQVVEHKLIVVQGKIKQVLETIKKYCFLTKYQKRI